VVDTLTQCHGRLHYKLFDHACCDPHRPVGFAAVVHCKVRYDAFGALCTRHAPSMGLRGQSGASAVQKTVRASDRERYVPERLPYVAKAYLKPMALICRLYLPTSFAGLEGEQRCKQSLPHFGAY
jgi:hypothetical protein